MAEATTDESQYNCTAKHCTHPSTHSEDQMRQKCTLLSALFALVLATLFAPPVASADDRPQRNGECDSGEVCFYFNSNQAGSLSDMDYSLANYGSGSSCNHFLGGGQGGVCLKNNAASAWNRSSRTVRVYFHSGYEGDFQDVASNAKTNLSYTLKNKNASHQFLDAPPTLPDVPPTNGGGFVGNSCVPVNRLPPTVAAKGCELRVPLQLERSMVVSGAWRIQAQSVGSKHCADVWYSSYEYHIIGGGLAGWSMKAGFLAQCNFHALDWVHLNF